MRESPRIFLICEKKVHDRGKTQALPEPAVALTNSIPTPTMALKFGAFDLNRGYCTLNDNVISWSFQRRGLCKTRQVDSLSLREIPSTRHSDKSETDS